jgi:gliding motility-associated-like protein
LDSARSNEVCLNQDPAIFIPNAFHPGGSLNDIFYPSNGFVDTKSYSLHIFNRWGEVVFQTNNPRVGWDGSSNGKRAPEAVYIYRLIATTSDGTPIEKVGSVTLIR